MEDLKMIVEDVSSFIVRATIIRDIVNDLYALAKTIEWELRHTPASFRRAKKDSYKTKEMEVKLCELKFQKGIRMHIQFGDDDYIRNKLFIIIDKDDDYSIDILSAGVNNLITTRKDILDLLIDLINNRHYKYIKPVITKEHAIMIYGNSILNSIECNKFSDRNYNQLKCNNPKYVCEDKEMGAIIYPDLKAAQVEDGKAFIGEI